VRRQAHVFLAASDDDVGVTTFDSLCGEMHRFESAAAQLVYRHRRAFLRQPCFHRRLACRILTGCRGQDLTHDDFIDLLRSDAVAL
jgi:hypothetical protein